jgi:hypothetical protein
MRTFQDDSGATWVASVKERLGDDYKGRFHLVMEAEGSSPDGKVELEDVRWNSEKTAKRTLMTMSVKELRRRLRWAVGRGVRV